MLSPFNARESRSTVNDAEIYLMVLKHTNAMHTLPIDRAKNRAANLAFWRKVDRLKGEMPPEDGAHFKERIHFYMDEALEFWREAIDQIPDTRTALQPAHRPRQSSYVGRTVVRAVVWNIVNSLFRVFR